MQITSLISAPLFHLDSKQKQNRRFGAANPSPSEIIDLQESGVTYVGTIFIALFRSRSSFIFMCDQYHLYTVFGCQLGRESEREIINCTFRVLFGL